MGVLYSRGGGNASASQSVSSSSPLLISTSPQHDNNSELQQQQQVVLIPQPTSRKSILSWSTSEEVQQQTVVQQQGKSSSIPDYFLLIPAELSNQILSHFDSVTLCRIACVSKVFYNLATDERIWKELYYHDFKEENAFYRTFFSDRKILIWRLLYRDSKLIEKRLKKGSLHHRCIKLVVTGDNMQGQKTNLLLSYVHNACPDVFYKGYIPTVFDNNVLRVKAVGSKENHSIELGLWDTSGHEEFERLRPLSYANTNVFLLIFSVVDPASFENVSRRWYPEVRLYCPDAPILLVGIQRDLRHDIAEIRRLRARNQKPISVEQGLQLAKKLSLPYYELSTNTGEGLNSAFRAAIKSALFAAHTIKDGAKFPLSKKQRKDTPLFIAIEGHHEPFQQSRQSELRSINEFADIADGWELCETDAGDQYWYNRLTKESTLEDNEDAQKQPNTVVISEPFNVKHRESMTNMLQIKTSSDTILGSVKQPYVSASSKLKPKAVSRLEITSPTNVRRASLTDDKFNTVPNARIPSHRRSQSISLTHDTDEIEISEPFNFRKNSVDLGANSVDVRNSRSFSISRTTDPLPRRNQPRPQTEDTKDVKISRPFNLQYQFGLKPKNPASSHTL